MLFMSRGENELKVAGICDVFGKEYPNSITQDEYFFFLDSLFRGIYKSLVKKDGTTTKLRQRVRAEDILTLSERVFQGNEKLSREGFIQNFSGHIDFYLFFVHLSEHMEKSLVYARDEFLKNMRAKMEIKRLLIDLTIKVEENLKPKKKE